MLKKFTPLLLAFLAMATPQVASASMIDNMLQNGQSSLDARKLSEATRMLQRVIEIDPTNAIAHKNLCQALELQSKIEQALAACRGAIAINPRDGDAYYRLGMVYANAQNYNAAMINMRRAIGLESQNVKYYISLGEVLQKQGELEEAMELYKQVLELSPGFTVAQTKLQEVETLIKQNQKL